MMTPTSSTFTGKNLVAPKGKAKKLTETPGTQPNTEATIYTAPLELIKIGTCTLSIDCGERTNVFTRIYQIFRFIFTGKLTV